MRELAALLIGYLLGSVLPADLLARARGMDIRALGDGNPGTTNAMLELGVVPGLLTGLYDASVGLAAMYVASRLGLASEWIYLAGMAAIVGHCYPVFFGFRGGQGMAAATGMLVYEVWVALDRSWVSTLGIVALVALALVAFTLARSGTVVGIAVLPPLVVQVLFARPDWQTSVFVTALAGFIWATQVAIARRDHLFRAAVHRA